VNETLKKLFLLLSKDYLYWNKTIFSTFRSQINLSSDSSTCKKVISRKRRIEVKRRRLRFQMNEKKCIILFVMMFQTRHFSKTSEFVGRMSYPGTVLPSLASKFVLFKKKT
jgi:hypothetical protein